MVKVGAKYSSTMGEKEHLSTKSNRSVSKMPCNEPVTVQVSGSVNVNIENHRNEANANTSADLKKIKIVSDIALFCLKRCWMSCSAAVFVIFVMYWYYGSVIALFLFFFSLSGLFYQISDWLLYHPDQPPHSRLFVPLPSMFGLPSESFFLKCADGTKINAVFIKQDTSIAAQVPTILYLHGNAGNIGHRLANVQGLFHICGCNILLIEYRGYGHSEGSPSEEGLYLDAQEGLRYLLQLPYIDRSKIIIFGRSLGGAVAIDLVSRPEFGKHVLLLAVENTFTSIPDIAKVLFNWNFVKWLPTWAFKNQFLSYKKISKIKVPMLFISGLADALIPPHMMKSLYQLSGSTMKRIIPFESGTHNETWQCKNYYRTLNMFIDDIKEWQHKRLRWVESEPHVVVCAAAGSRGWLGVLAENSNVMLAQHELRQWSSFHGPGEVY